MRDLFRHEAAAGVLLLIAAVVAMLVVNSPLAPAFHAVLDFPLRIGVGSFGLQESLLLWINDGLMAVFFLQVGMELKHELLEGQLASKQRAALPAIAAVGGMLFPALIYCVLNWGDTVALRGWAIPTATDIAFALGVLALLGKRVPAGLKAFLLGIAIFDDLGAIAIIAVFYAGSLSMPMLAAAAGLTALLALLNRLKVQALAVYLLLGAALWLVVLKSGVHATLAGVVLAMFIPSKRLGQALQPWVIFGILPLFALANAGVAVTGLAPAALLQPVPFGVMLGLFFGKQAGIMVASLFAVRTRAAMLPAGVDWMQIYGTALLCGIGFTMSLFIAGLASQGFEGGPFGLERLGVLSGTLLSGCAGYLVLRRALPRV
jgi:Na+:H+ antiporter, NhaA family